MKVSPVAIKLSLPRLTNVKKGNVLGITPVRWCFILLLFKFPSATRAQTMRYAKYPYTPLVFHPVFFTGIPGHNE
jgi:hypothetical protein